MRTKSNLESEFTLKLTEEIQSYHNIVQHDSECPFRNSKGLCIMMNKSCVSVPTLLCTSTQKAWYVGYSVGHENGARGEE